MRAPPTLCWLLVQPCRHQASAEVETVVRRPVLHVWLPGRHHLHRGPIEIVRMVRHMTLDVVDDVTPLGDVECSALRSRLLRRSRYLVRPGVPGLGGQHRAAGPGAGIASRQRVGWLPHSVLDAAVGIGTQASALQNSASRSRAPTSPPSRSTAPVRRRRVADFDWAVWLRTDRAKPRCVLRGG